METTWARVHKWVESLVSNFVKVELAWTNSFLCFVLSHDIQDVSKGLAELFILSIFIRWESHNHIMSNIDFVQEELLLQYLNAFWILEYLRQSLEPLWFSIKLWAATKALSNIFYCFSNWLDSVPNSFKVFDIEEVNSMWDIGVKLVNVSEALWEVSKFFFVECSLQHASDKCFSVGNLEMWLLCSDYTSKQESN